MFKIHHIGLIVKDLEKDSQYYVKTLKWVIASEVIYDPIQKVKLQFFKDMNYDKILYELIEPVEKDSPSSDWLKKGNSLHHLCYEVDNLKGAINEIISQGGFLITGPVPAVAFNNRKIAFLLTRQKLIVELLEKNK